MDAAKLLDEIERKVQDSSYTREMLLEVLNEGLVYIAGHFPLPELQTSEEVSTVLSQGSIPLPDTFHWNLWHVWNKTKSWECRSVYSRRTLEELHPDSTTNGSVEDVVDEGGSLHYRKIPSEVETMVLYFNTFPADLTDDQSSKPTCLPKHLHKRLLVNYVAAEVFSEIEDGIEGQKVNTTYYWNRFLAAYRDMERYFPSVARQKRYIPRRIKFF